MSITKNTQSFALQFVVLSFVLASCSSIRLKNRVQPTRLDFAAIFNQVYVSGNPPYKGKVFVSPLAYYRKKTPFFSISNPLDKHLSEKEKMVTQSVQLPDSSVFQYYNGSIKEACLDTVLVCFISPILTDVKNTHKYVQLLFFYSHEELRVMNDRTFIINLDKSGNIAKLREIESYEDFAPWLQGQLPNFLPEGAAVD